jgi:hypothetical protein
MNKREVLSYYSNYKVDEKASVYPYIYKAIARCALNEIETSVEKVDIKDMKRTCDFIHSRRDCIDFVMEGVIYMLSKYGDSNLLTGDIKALLKDALIKAPYWIDEKGVDDLCMFTENHLILFHTCEYLAGKLYPNEIFENNRQSGKWHMEHAKPLILLWMDMRMKYGFSEWNSNTYYDEDLLALTCLYSLCEDEELSTKAANLITILLYEIISQSVKGIMGCSHGRAYVDSIINTRKEGTSGLATLFFDSGRIDEAFSLSIVLLADSDYEPPEWFREIGSWKDEIEIRERHSFSVETGEKMGIDPKDMKYLPVYWGMQLFDHPSVLQNTLKLLPKTHYHRPISEAFQAYYDDLKKEGKEVPTDAEYFALTEANVYTYRTPDTMMSTVCNFRKGQNGYQQHIWQATLGENAVVFVTHPGSDTYNNIERPNALHGNAVMPNAAEYKNVIISIYRPRPSISRRHYTHAYFPVEAFDEVTEKNGWYFGKKGKGYVALKSNNPSHWEDMDDRLKEINGFQTNKPCIIHAIGGLNVWICETGREAEWGSFDIFVNKIAEAKTTGDTEGFVYESPSLGQLTYGWNKKLTVDKQEIKLTDFPRIDSPWCYSEYGSGIYEFWYQDKKVILK